MTQGVGASEFYRQDNNLGERAVIIRWGSKACPESGGRGGIHFLLFLQSRSPVSNLQATKKIKCLLSKIGRAGTQKTESDEER